MTQARTPKDEPLDHLLSIPIFQGHNLALKAAARKDHRSVSAYVRLLILQDLVKEGYLNEDFELIATVDSATDPALPAVKAS